MVFQSMFLTIDFWLYPIAPMIHWNLIWTQRQLEWFLRGKSITIIFHFIIDLVKGIFIWLAERRNKNRWVHVFSLMCLLLDGRLCQVLIRRDINRGHTCLKTTNIYFVFKVVIKMEIRSIILSGWMYPRGVCQSVQKPQWMRVGGSCLKYSSRMF